MIGGGLGVRLMRAEKWLILPPARKWYRNLLCVFAVVEALGSF